MKLTFSTSTDAGDIRGNNEDSIFAKVFEADGHTVGMFAVADGCGGLDSGEEVSSLIVMRLEAVADMIISGIVRIDGYQSENFSVLLDSELRGFNSEITGYFRGRGQRAGSTLSLLLMIDREYAIKNIGDSRVYLCRRKKLKLLTEDQSVAAELVRSGEPDGYQNKNALTMCIGMFDELEISTSFGRISAGDRFIVCSDGFYRAVDEYRIAESLGSYRQIETAAEHLRGEIPPGGATDNVSLIVCGYEQDRIPGGLLTRFLKK